jgi:small subunit ribosomal protein S9
MADDETTPTPDPTAPAEEQGVEAAEAQAAGEAEAAPEPPAVEAEAVVEAEAPAESEAEAEAVEAVAQEVGEPVVEADVVAVEAEPKIEAEAVIEAEAAVEPEAEEAPRVKPAIPGADLEVDIVPEGADPLARAEAAAEAQDGAPGAEAEGEPATERGEEEEPAPVPQATIDLAAGARYRATGKRKTAIARVILRPGTGAYTVNGKPLDGYFPRPTLQRNIRQPLETVGYEERMDVVASLVGGGVSAQAGALRHGISRALLEADPNLRGELKRRGFLTRDARAKERKKAGLKKARKRPQFSKR